MAKTINIYAQRFPYPAVRGDQLAISKMINYALKFGVTVNLFITENYSMDNLPKDVIGELNIKKLEFSIFKFLKNLILHPFDPLQLKIFSGFKVDTNKYPDAIHYVHTIRMTRLFERKEFHHVYLGAQIDFAKEFKERSIETSGLKNILYKLESYLIDKWQKTNFKNFKSIFRVVETEFLDAGQECNIQTFPHGFNIERCSPKKTKSQIKTSTPLTIGMWGNFEFSPNQKAAQRLINWSKTSKRNDKILLFGIGSNNFPETAGIICLGKVKDIDEVIRKCDVQVNLINAGAGFQNKTIEAWAQGIPTIGFKQAFRGLPKTDDLIIQINKVDDLDITLESIDLNYVNKIGPEWIKTNWDMEYLAIQKLKYMEVIK